MLNRSASLAMSTCVLRALPGKFDIKDTHLVFSIYRKFNNHQVAFSFNTDLSDSRIIASCAKLVYEMRHKVM